MENRKYEAFERALPYFELVRRALGDLVEGDHFFDAVANDIVYEVRYEVAGWPRVINGRAELMERFRGYCEHVELHSADRLIVHKADDDRVVVMEYEVHGRILASGVRYDNRFCSIVELASRRMVHWRDYMDSLAAWNALTGGARA